MKYFFLTKQLDRMVLGYKRLIKGKGYETSEIVITLYNLFNLVCIDLNYYVWYRN